jgi:sialate O-acetylesterase
MKLYKLFSGIILSLLLLTMAQEGHAKVKLPSLFNEGMVLQRDQKIPVWGWADPAEQVKITFNNKTYTTVAGKDSTWSVSMEAMKAGGPYTMAIAGHTNTITIKDILMGDVWVCSGQSNMEFTLSGSKALYPAEIANSTNPNIRHFYVKKTISFTPLTDVTSFGWRSANPQSVLSFSAVAYFFAKAMYEKYHVPIGLIHASWGGTTIQNWMNKESLKEFPEKKKSAEFMEANYEKIKVAELEKPVAKRRSFLGSPTALFNGMIAPLTAYGVKGVLWYQGESDSKRAFEYQKLFPAMIKGWRSQWKQEKLPFIYVQLPNYGPVNTSPSESGWAELREAQAMALSLPETGMAITLDIGEKGNVHPLNKADVGKRLALVAQHVVYGEPIVYSGPLYEKMQIKGNKVTISFSNVGGGLQAKDGENLKNFAIAGADQRFVWAKAKIKRNKVIVWSDEISLPVAVRYAWADSPEDINLYNKEGLPAAGFRTDNWPGITVPK